MAKCEQGYLCDVCGQDVERLTDSELYLRYVVGLIEPEVLHTFSERHLRCNPALAQYVDDDDFQPVFCPGPFDKRSLDPQFVQQQTLLISRGYRRLKELSGVELPIVDYPLPEVRAKWDRRA